MTTCDLSAPVPKLDVGLNVLVVDDNHINCLVAGNYCEVLGCKVEIANDGAEAVRLCESTIFSVVLMDIRMPGMDGIEAARRIRGLPDPAGQVPIIAVTGDGDLKDSEIEGARLASILVKPITLHALFSVMKKTLDAGKVVYDRPQERSAA